jgi:hypothetical protein
MEFFELYGIGDWGLGIGPIGPNPQSPIPNPHLFKNKIKYKNFILINKKTLNIMKKLKII